jgi:chorismate mutase
MNRKSDWQTMRRRLASEKASVAQEIATYPAPIPACDEQFNHLLERRRTLAQEIDRVDRLHNGVIDPADDRPQRGQGRSP